VASGLEHPWALAFLPDGRMLVTERPGRLRVLTKDGRLDSRPVEGLPRVDPQGQGGLMDVMPHPDFSRNGWVYWTYAQRGDGNGNGTELARGRLAGGPGNYRMEQVQVLFRMQPKTSAGQHFGSRLVFDREGALYMTLGDRGEKDSAQDLADHRGKIVRLTDDGKPAPRNPFLQRPGARPEVFSYGHRNVQGAALHPATGELWAAEHGPQGGDEVNLALPSRNFGWPDVSYGCNYGAPVGTACRIGGGTHVAPYTEPLAYWHPISTAQGGMAFYTGTRFPEWQGSLFVGGLAGRTLWRFVLNGNAIVGQEPFFAGQHEIRDVRQGPDGWIYLISRSAGQILRVER
jgi:glucose/arabinose dehydrogenase